MTLYRYVWGPRWPNVLGGGFNRKGEVCEVLARGTMNSRLVRFLTDGFMAVVSGNALRKEKGGPDGRRHGSQAAVRLSLFVLLLLHDHARGSIYDSHNFLVGIGVSDQQAECLSAFKCISLNLQSSVPRVSNLENRHLRHFSFLAATLGAVSGYVNPLVEEARHA